VLEHKRISNAEWEKFFRHYTWEKLQNPYYRLGQALIYYFRNRRNTVECEDADHNPHGELYIYYQEDDAVIMRLIEQWRQHK
jgi:hypothetical protein